MISASTQSLYNIAHAMAATGQAIYAVKFHELNNETGYTEQSPAMGALIAGADSVAAIKRTVDESLNSADRSVAARAAQFLICCCVEADRARVQSIVRLIDPTASSENLFQIHNAVIFNMQSWLDEIKDPSEEIYGRIVGACKHQDQQSLKYWFCRGVKRRISLRYFANDVGHIQFLLAGRRELSMKCIKKLSKTNYRLQRTGGNSQNINNFFKSLIAKMVMTEILNKQFAK